MTLPIKILIEVTNRCNLACPICHTGRGILTRKKRDLSLDEYVRILGQVKFAKKILLYNQGEPLLNINICEMVVATNKLGIKTYISTNGMLLTSEMSKKLATSGLTHLTICLDGFDQFTLEKYRKNARFEQLVENIRNLASLKGETKVELQFVVMKHNEHQIDKVREFAKEVGVTFTSKTVGIDINDPEFQELAKKFVPEIEESRYLKTEQGFVLKEEKESLTCNLLKREVVILSNGDVIPCCYDFHSEYVMGNVFKEDFKTIWVSEKFQKFRKNIQQCKMCKTCS